MAYIVYKTTNMKNGMVYIGVHKTKNPNTFDGYLGSGGSLKKAISEFGSESFVREVLHVFDTAEEAYHMESEIVTEDFVLREDVYNTALGGKLGRGFGWDNVNNSPLRKVLAKEHSNRMTGEGNPMYGLTRTDHSERMSGSGNSFHGKSHSEETKEVIRRAKVGRLVGEDNPMFIGWYVTPAGEFPSKKAAMAANGMKDGALNRRLNSDAFPDFWFRPK